ncbi:hypothetical protein JCM9279_002788 [Rhodotorula babjevae]
MVAQLHAGHSDASSMDGMSMGMDNSTTAAMMSTAFTTSLGSSNLWFQGWTPTSAAATFGACLGLFFLAVLSRVLAAVKVCAEAAWSTSLAHHRAHRGRRGPISLAADADAGSPAPQDQDDDKASQLDPQSAPSYPLATSVSPSTPSRPSPSPTLYSPPFLLAIDLPRALLLGLQAFVAYLVMLAVMSYNAYFFVAVLVGLMTGELAVGRYVAAFGGADAAHGGHGEGWLHG